MTWNATSEDHEWFSSNRDGKEKALWLGEARQHFQTYTFEEESLKYLVALPVHKPFI